MCEVPVAGFDKMACHPVHNKRLTHIEPTPSGSYSFLETAEVGQ